MGHFFYLPVFKNLPRSIKTTDGSRYAITIEATPDCSLTLTRRGWNMTVQSGQSVTLFPRHLEPIRVISKPATSLKMNPRQSPVIVGKLLTQDLEEIQRIVLHTLREHILPSSEYVNDPKFYERQVKEYETQRILWIGVQSDGHVEVFAGVNKKAIASEGYALDLWKDPKWRTTGCTYWGMPEVRPQLPAALAPP